MANARILVVEDEAVVALDLERRLRELGYEVTGRASTGLEALAKVSESPPDLVLMDVRLRHTMDGIEAAERIRRQADLPVVFLTAHGDDVTLERAKAARPYGYLVKPAGERDIRTTIEVALHMHAAESRLRRMERWLATTLGSIGDGVVSTDVDGLVTFLNPAAERIVGWKAEEARGRRVDEVLCLFDGHGLPLASRVVSRALAEGAPVGLGDESVVVTKDGRTVPIDDSAAAIRDDEGKVSGVVIVFRDASRQRAAEAALRRSEESLRHSQRLEALGRLAGGVAHDFNNLMTVVLGYADLLLNSAVPPERARTAAAEIRRAADSAAALTRQMLAFGRRQMLRPRLIDLNALVEGARGLLRPLLREDVELVFRPADDLAPVRADPAQLEQVLVNLAANARDAMPAGGTLTIATANVVLDGAAVRANPDARPGPHVRLSVSDTGQGMTPDVAARVFEPYFTTKKPGKGTGLGLSIVYGIVAQSGGHVTVRTAPGEGAAFDVFLPAADDDARGGGAGAAGGADARATGTETVLVVDDNPGVRDLLAAVLRDAGYRVLLAGSGDEAARLSREHEGPLPLVVTDVAMPGVRGPDLVARLRADRPDLRALYVSGYPEAAAPDPGRPPSAFLRKPFNPDDLRRRVRDLLDRPVGGVRAADRPGQG